MSLFRLDATSNDWVIFAPERVKRPHDFTKEGAASHVQDGLCPFCPGNEHLAGPEIYSIRTTATEWQVRVIANKFPALRIEEDNRRQREGHLFASMGGCGAHEVIIESPDHDRFLAHQPVEHIERVLQALRARFQDLMRDTRFQTIVIFKNHGERAGTSLRHPHWQLIATPVVPRLLRLKHAVATDYFDRSGRCVYCTLLEDELAFQKRVLVENAEFAAILPYASHVPFEIAIYPKAHCSSFGLIDASLLRPLAEICREVLGKLHLGLGNPDFNVTINTAPRGDESKGYFLWHIQIMPRLTTPAGFELGSGMFINTVLPEAATRFLRDVEFSDHANVVPERE